jgi:hypothetical protein
MKRARFGWLLLFPIGLLTACAAMPVVASVAPATVTPPPALVPPVAPAPPPATPAQFIADQRTEARRLDASGMPTQASQHWRYVLALLPRDDEATGEIARLDALIRTRRDAALAQGEVALTRSRVAEAQSAFLKVLTLDGGNEQARRRLRELESRAAFAKQDRKDAHTRAARPAGTEEPEN